MGVQVWVFGAALLGIIACIWLLPGYRQEWVLSAALSSSTACILLLVHICRVPANVRNRLFFLQIRCLALADLCYVISCVPSLFLEDYGPYLNTDTLVSVCKNQYLLLNFSRHVSLWIEIHLAASVVLQFFKVQALSQLRRALYLIWLPGLLLTMCSAFIQPWTYDPVERLCAPSSSLGTADPVDIAGLALCISICAGSYLTVVCGSWMQQTPGSVQNRASRKAANYLVNALFTYGPIFVCYVDDQLFRHPTMLTIAWVFELWGGLFNTFTYAMQSRYRTVLFGRSTLVREHPPALQRLSFDVAFVADVEVADEVAFAADFDAVDSRPPSFRQS